VPALSSRERIMMGYTLLSEEINPFEEAYKEGGNQGSRLLVFNYRIWLKIVKQL
jgi:hypothetical protein